MLVESVFQFSIARPDARLAIIRPGRKQGAIAVPVQGCDVLALVVAYLAMFSLFEIPTGPGLLLLYAIDSTERANNMSAKTTIFPPPTLAKPTTNRWPGLWYLLLLYGS